MSEEFGVRAIDAGDDVIVVVTGEVDIESQARLRCALDVARTGGRRLVVDLARTTFVDRTAVEVLLRAHLAQADAGTTMVLRSPPERLVRMFRVLGLHTVFLIEPGAAAPTPPRPEPARAEADDEAAADEAATTSAGRPHAASHTTAHGHAGLPEAAGRAGDTGGPCPPALPRRVPGRSWRHGEPGREPATEPAEASAAGARPALRASLPDGGRAVLTPEAATLMGRFEKACEALAEAADIAARLQARLADPWWPIEVREVEVARYLAHANDARSRAHLVAAQLVASTVRP